MIEVIFLSVLFFPFFVISVYTLFYKALIQLFFKQSVKNKEEPPKISLVIALYNEEKVILQKIQNTKTLVYPKNKIEVIFLNDYSTDNSLNIIKNSAKELPFTWKIVNNKGHKGKPGALNYLLPRLKTEIVIITDSDSFIEKKAILKLIRNFQEKTIGGVSGRLNIIKPPENKEEYRKELEYRTFYDTWRLGESIIHSISVCNGPLMAFRTDLIKDISLTTKSGCSADDTELAFHIVRKGFRTVYDPEAIAYEVTPSNKIERRSQKMRRAFGLMYCYLHHLDLFKIKRFNINFCFAIFTIVISPFLILLSTLIYPFLVFFYPLFLIGLVIFFIPKLGPIFREFYSMQLLMSMSPFFSKGWSKAKSSREELSK